MEYITACNVLMSDSPEEIACEVWYSLWEKEVWPYTEVSPLDIVYFLEKPKDRLMWKASITGIYRFKYDDKYTLREKLLARYPEAAVDVASFEGVSDAGYCLAYRVNPLHSLNIPKPDGLVFPALGWLRVDEQVRKEWVLKE